MLVKCNFILIAFMSAILLSTACSNSTNAMGNSIEIAYNDEKYIQIAAKYVEDNLNAMENLNIHYEENMLGIDSTVNKEQVITLNKALAKSLEPKMYSYMTNYMVDRNTVYLLQDLKVAFKTYYNNCSDTEKIALGKYVSENKLPLIADLYAAIIHPLVVHNMGNISYKNLGEEIGKQYTVEINEAISLTIHKGLLHFYIANSNSNKPELKGISFELLDGKYCQDDCEYNLEIRNVKLELNSTNYELVIEQKFYSKYYKTHINSGKLIHVELKQKELYVYIGEGKTDAPIIIQL